MDQVQELTRQVAKLQNGKEKDLQEKNKIMSEKSKAVHEKNKIILEKNNAMQEKNKMMMEKAMAVEEKNKLKVELEKLRKLVKELQGAVECRVCLVVPREGPVPCCSAGHITCSPCLERMRREGKRGCPTCRLPMGEGRSLLAKMVIENMEHECSLEGCKAMVAFEDYKRHQEACSYRLVLCPGNNVKCSKIVAYCEVAKHFETCQDSIKSMTQMNTHECTAYDFFCLPEASLQDPTSANLCSKRFKCAAGKTFFLRINKCNKILSIEVVMVGSEEECRQVRVEVGVLGSESRPWSKDKPFKATFSPRPISATNSEGLCLMVKQSSLGQICKYDKACLVQFCVTVKVHSL